LARLVCEPAAPGGEGDQVGADVAAELARVSAALDAVATQLAERADRAEGVTAEILFATSAMAADPALVAATEQHLSRGCPTGQAVTLAVDGFCARLAASGGYLAERVADLRDVGARAVALLTGVEMPAIPAPGHPIVLSARELAPADAATLPGSDVVALLTEEGGPTGHTAILAKSLGLPAVVGCAAASSIPEGMMVLVDGSTGEVRVDPPAGAVRSVARTATAPARSADPSRRADAAPGRTRDGRKVSLLSNIGTVADATAAAATATEGVGLFRTEFLFLDRRDRPTSAEQARVYSSVLAAFGDRPVVVRTLDAGSDKPLPFLRLGDERNPALGVRGLRTARVHPEVLADQLDALAEAASTAGRPVRVMAPMVTTGEEAQCFVDLARARGLDEVGVMIEVPAAALRAGDVLDVVDFVSIGTNDLGQYTMAADRTSGVLGQLLDPWHPALLDLVAMVGAAAKARGKPVGVCGEAAGDGLLAAVLVGLGADSLSMVPACRPSVHQRLAGLTLEDCAAIADAARRAGSAEQARSAAEQSAEARWVSVSG
jgi:phosphotransferase system enzyme I (PtsI)